MFDQHVLKKYKNLIYRLTRTRFGLLTLFFSDFNSPMQVDQSLPENLVYKMIHDCSLVFDDKETSASGAVLLLLKFEKHGSSTVLKGVCLLINKCPLLPRITNFDLLSCHRTEDFFLGNMYKEICSCFILCQGQRNLKKKTDLTAAECWI